MSYPVIGVTTSNGAHLGQDALYLMRAYVAALTEAGAAPVLIPSVPSGESWRSLYECLDGILFSGGGDINPACFNGEPHPSVHNVDDGRDAFEFTLLREAIKDKKPFLGICRGFQVINVGLGGTLYTHIKDQMPSALQHKNSSRTRRSYLAHTVKIAESARLGNLLGETEFLVNSMHHQGAKDIPPTLKPVAYAPDGLVEGLEAPDHPFGIAIQWHPECLPEQPVTRRLFRAFVQAADEYPLCGHEYPLCGHEYHQR